ncbi:NAD(P)-dependent oxidoreductase [Niabella aquatica]
MEKDRNIGFIGLGIMGKPMALNLIKAGFKLHICTQNTATQQELQALEATLLKSPAAVAAVSDIVITMLPDTSQVQEVVLGVNGVIESVMGGALYIDMSTIDAAAERDISRRLKQKNVECLDAPVSGGQQGAVNGTLSVMVGGSERAFERALPMFEVLGSRVIHMGDNGAGQVAKSCNQIATALATQGIAEAFTLAKKSGVDLVRLRAAMLGGFAASKALEVAGERIIANEFTPGFTLQLYNKDLRIANDSALNAGLHLPGTLLVQKEMSLLIERNLGMLDFSALIKMFE